jgi:RHH-type transcriptional regulator, proline utilization regulon repressor / proline dehydrogenase / delta 1-pyrroline-5-carboxylate dehydrogenase
MLSEPKMNRVGPLDRDAIRAVKLAEEGVSTAWLLAGHGLTDEQRQIILNEARTTLRRMRSGMERSDLVQALFRDMDLGSSEGLALMSLAEALLRVPDAETAEALIQEKLAQGNWSRFRAGARSPGMKAAGLLIDIAARLTGGDSLIGRGTGSVTLRVIRGAAQQIIQVMASRFVFAPTIESALSAAIQNKTRERYSFDMLGEGARTRKQAEHFLEAYGNAIGVLGQAVADKEFVDEPSISVKLSALHPRFEAHQSNSIKNELLPRVEELATYALSRGVGFTIDAEEADRLEPTLDVFEGLARAPCLKGWNGLGLVVQAYGKRADAVIDWVDALGEATNARYRIRLVKGAYWDTEVKHAQSLGLSDYPVFTHKAATDVSYLACARKLLASDYLAPQFATHNVHTVTAIRHLAEGRSFEFQRLHGMGEQLYDALRADGMKTPVRVYAPVGRFQELLPYLIRRMLENTANSSFVHAAFDPRYEVAEVVQDPISILQSSPPRRVPLPAEIFPGRRNSAGIDLADTRVFARLERAAKQRRAPTYTGGTSAAAVHHAITAASLAFESWRNTPIHERARILERTADILEERIDDFAGLITREARRTLRDAVAEVREAVDFCRYYAVEGRRLFTEMRLPGVTGERNVLRLSGRGVFACISPWNFPLAIFLGQVSAALVAGNTVIAKPAEQTPQIAAEAIDVLLEAGLPSDVIHLVQGGATVGEWITNDSRISGVAFTGSTTAALSINRTLAARNGPIAVLIAETGGVNAMLVDASALLEQVTDDVIASGFLSAGQRCSSLRHLFVQDDIAEDAIEMIAGAMDTLRVGDPAEPETDVGPLIDAAAAETVRRHISTLQASGARLVKQAAMPSFATEEAFVPPTLIELRDPAMLTQEIFGPVVHVTRWQRRNLDQMLQHVNGNGYGLTLGVHSRIASFARHVISRTRCGNSYVNRNMIGAVVGAQPFGGRGLSGTGPKAGGPHYLPRFAMEEVVTENLTAIGGDVDLLTR